MYINSPGTTTEDGRPTGFESEAFAIYDTMNYCKAPVHTVLVGKAYGLAAMLLAAGDKGCRHALPNAQIMTHPPKLNRTFDTSVNVQIRANEDHETMPGVTAGDLHKRVATGELRSPTGHADNAGGGRRAAASGAAFLPLGSA